MNRKHILSVNGQRALHIHVLPADIAHLYLHSSSLLVSMATKI